MVMKNVIFMNSQYEYQSFLKDVHYLKIRNIRNISPEVIIIARVTY